MSYAIGYIVYGVSLHNAPESCKDDLNYIQESDLAESRYNGSGEYPLFIGVEKGTIDECGDIEVSDLTKIKVTDADKADFEEQKQDLIKECEEEMYQDEYKFSDQFKEWLKNSAKPTLFITWGSS